jgi:ABC-type nickel/cobalt efflux system permease component RcnA
MICQLLPLVAPLNVLPDPASTWLSSGSLAAILLSGFIVGLWHALDADHLAAVSTIVSERRSLLSSSLIGGWWGLGHTCSLLLAGVAVILLQVRISPRLEQAMEFCVALMLVGLGLNVFYKLLRGSAPHVHAHTHGTRTHIHPHFHTHTDEARSHHGLKLGARPLLIGMVHGLAGSAGLFLLGIAAIQSVFGKFAYIALFGIGSVGGMMLMSSLLSLPAYFTAARFAGAYRAVRLLAGCFSFGFGVWMMYEIGFVSGLLR